MCTITVPVGLPCRAVLDVACRDQSWLSLFSRNLYSTMKIWSQGENIPVIAHGGLGPTSEVHTSSETYLPPVEVTKATSNRLHNLRLPWIELIKDSKRVSFFWYRSLFMLGEIWLEFGPDEKSVSNLYMIVMQWIMHIFVSI